MPVPDTYYQDRLKQAIIQKAVRFLKLPEAPFGHSGVSDWGPASVREDKEIRELLYGMMYHPIGDLSALVTTTDVIRVGLQSNDTDFGGATADVQRAINSACSWIEEYLGGGLGIA